MNISLPQATGYNQTLDDGPFFPLKFDHAAGGLRMWKEVSTAE
jgi:hypothetical protein